MPNLSVLENSTGCFLLMSIKSLAACSVVFVILNVVGGKVLLKSFQIASLSLL